jgi:hypothetical protein
LLGRGRKRTELSDTQDALIAQVQASFKRLSNSSSVLNTASDQLNASVSALEVSLKKLGLGISSWVPFEKWASQDGLKYRVKDIGYAKVNGKWGLAIKSRSGHEISDEDEVEIWPFNEAPRQLRVLAVKSIPALLDQLYKDSVDIASQVNKGKSDVDILTQAISQAVDITPAETPQVGKK